MLQKVSESWSLVLIGTPLLRNFARNIDNITGPFTYETDGERC